MSAFAHFSIGVQVGGLIKIDGKAAAAGVNDTILQGGVIHMKALLVFADYLEDAQAVNLTHNAEIHQAILHIELGRAVPAAAVKAAI